MKTHTTMALIGISLGLLAAAGVTHFFQLWSFLGNYTVPWFCGALAIAILLVTLTAVLTGCAPAEIPRPRMMAVTVFSSILIGLGMLVDGFAYQAPPDWTASLAEWIGFSAILYALFQLPRTKDEDPKPNA